MVLDLTQSLPEEVEIVQNHSGKSIEEKNISARTWFDNLKISQAKYLKKNSQQSIESEKDQKSNVKNLTISNKIKGILNMEYDE